MDLARAAATLDAWPETADARWPAVLRAFATHHLDDPREFVRDGVAMTISLDYHARVSAWVRRLDGDAEIAVRLAALAQHVRRFELPRRDYPEGVVGYKRWRAAAMLRHVELAKATLVSVGYEPALGDRVGAVMLKKQLHHDPGAALLEDAVCLRFVQDELAAFAADREPEAVAAIVAKTWAKMSPAGHAATLAVLPSLPLSSRLVELVVAATAAG